MVVARVACMWVVLGPSSIYSLTAKPWRKDAMRCHPPASSFDRCCPRWVKGESDKIEIEIERCQDEIALKCSYRGGHRLTIPSHISLLICLPISPPTYLTLVHRHTCSRGVLAFEEHALLALPCIILIDTRIPRTPPSSLSFHPTTFFCHTSSHLHL